MATPFVRPSKPEYAPDVPLVVTELERFGPAGLEALRDEGLEVVVCHGSVTDHATDLRGKRPRGWPAGRTWDEVPGVYLPDRGEIVIALRSQGGAWRIPPTGDGHGSFNLVLHESMHGYDYKQGGARSRFADFRAARTADAAALGPYESQADPAGSEETYAESAARAFGEDPSLAGQWPTLAAFWSGFSFPGPMDDSEGVAAHAHGSGPVGFATLLPNRGIALDLRAEGPNGEVGHAVLVVPPTDPAMTAIAEHVFSGQEEAAPGAPVVVHPFP
jgi:hypothetical protein